MSTHLPTAATYSTIDLLISDQLGVFRGKRIDADALQKTLDNGMYLPASVFALDINGDTVEATGLGYAHGDSDRLCLAVNHTVNPTPWVKERGQLLMSMHEHDHSPFFADPRQVLTRLAEQFTHTTGLTPVVAVELEFYLLDQQRQTPDSVCPPIAPGTGQRDEATQVYSLEAIDNYSHFLQDVRSACRAQGIPASSAVAECAPAQFEVNLNHQANLPVACDNALLLKRTIRAIAHQHGFIATFMAKPYIDQPGNGMHIHISLVDDDGNNVFGDEKTLHNAVAGLLDTMRESTLLFAPTINAYRRLQPFMYAPTAPCWGYDNRSTAIRIPSSDAASLRIEHRVAGADANPYLLVSALLAGIQHGLDKGLTPPPSVTGNAYEQHPHQWPETLESAIDVFRQSDVIAPSLGNNFSKVYTCCRQADAAAFRQRLTRAEFDWYLSI